MPHENIDLIRDAYEKFARRDIPGIFTLFDDNIEFYQSELLPWGGNYHGVQAVKEFFAKLLQNIDSRVDPEGICGGRR